MVKFTETCRPTMNRGAPIVLSIALDMLSLVSFTVVAGLATQGLHAQIYSQWIQPRYHFCCQT
jgi:hypothetical protein